MVHAELMAVGNHARAKVAATLERHGDAMVEGVELRKCSALLHSFRVRPRRSKRNLGCLVPCECESYKQETNALSLGDVPRDRQNQTTASGNVVAWFYTAVCYLCSSTILNTKLHIVIANRKQQNI